MSLSTLLEAAKYLDYLDSSNNGAQGSSQQLSHDPAQGQASSRKPIRRPRATKKDGMVAMSLPTSGITGMPGAGMAIPSSSGTNPAGGDSQSAILSSSFTAGSPLSSPISATLLSSKTSGVTSNISSAASSLSSSGSSSSSGEILMSDLDYDQYGTSVGSNASASASTKPKRNNKRRNTSGHTGNNNNNNNRSQAHPLQIDSMEYLTSMNNQTCISNQTTYLQPTHQNEAKHQPTYPNKPIGSLPQPINAAGNDKRSARFKASRSAGPKILTLTVHPTLASASVPIESSSSRAGHVIQAAKSSLASSGSNVNETMQNHAGHMICGTSSSLSDICGSHPFINMNPSNFTTTGANFGSMHQRQSGQQMQTGPLQTGSMIMTRVQPMILNSLGHSAQQSIMAFEQATAQSPTSTNSSYSRHRELHKTLEKNRRAHLRHCFELLKAELPGSDCIDRKTSHINIIKSAIRCVLSLREQEAILDNEYKIQLEIKTKLSDLLSSSSSSNSNNNLSLQKQPVAEQQLSFLLSRSRID